MFHFTISPFLPFLNENSKMMKTLNLSISFLKTVNIHNMCHNYYTGEILSRGLAWKGILPQRKFVVFMCLSIPRSLKNVHSAVQMFKMFAVLCECLQLSIIWGISYKFLPKRGNQQIRTNSCQGEAANKFVQIPVKKRKPTRSQKLLSTTSC